MKPKHLFVIASLALIFIGAALRLAYLPVHGLDADEITSMSTAQKPLPLLLSDLAGTVIEVSPKLYHITYQPWLAIAGTSELAARLPNTLLDMLLASFVIASLARLFGARTALIFGVLWVTNPVLIWVSGMARMYSLFALLATVTWVCLLEAMATSKRRWWIAYAAALFLTIYTHVLGALVLVLCGAVVTLWTVFSRKPYGFLLTVLAASLYVPYAYSLWTVNSVDTLIGTGLPSTIGAFILEYTGVVLTNQIGLPATLSVVLALAFVILAVVAGSGKRQRWWTWGLIGIVILASAGAGYMALRRSVFEGRYIAYIVPIYLMVIALGISAFPGKLVRSMLLIGLIVAGAVGANAQTAPIARDDFPAGMRFLEQHADEDDLILVIGEYGRDTAGYYYHGTAPIEAPWHTVPGPVRVDALLSGLTGYDTIWLVLYQTNISDPSDRVDTWFRDRYPIRTEVFPTGLNVRGYDLRPMTSSLPPEVTPLDVAFDGGIRLRGYQLYQDEYSAKDTRLHPPSGWVHITLYWEADRAGVQFEPRVQIEDDQGGIWGLAFTRGSESYLRFPAADWLPGQIWRTDFDVNMNPVTPEGQYAVTVNVFTPGVAEPQPAEDANHSRIFRVVVQYIRLGFAP